jgi:hypothetical protein
VLVPRGGKLAALLIAAVSGTVTAAALVGLWLSRRELGRARQALVRPGSEKEAGWAFGPRPKAAAETEKEQGGPPVHPERPETERAEVDLAAPSADDTEGRPEILVEPGPRERTPSDAALIELLNDSRPSVRRNAVVALAIGGGREALRGLAYSAAKDPSVEVRREAILGLRSFVGGRSASSDGGRKA